MPDPLFEDYAGATLWAEEAAAKWLEARASGNLRAWRDASTKLDEAMNELRRTKHRYEKASHRAEKAATLQTGAHHDPTD